MSLINKYVRNAELYLKLNFKKFNTYTALKDIEWIQGHTTNYLLYLVSIP